MDFDTRGEFQESVTLTFEWTVRGIKNIFESSREGKSKAIRSERFGGGRWHVLFYGNTGVEGGYMGIYLCCEATAEERENALDGKWEREGSHKFKIELKDLAKSHVYNQKEAHNHKFSYKTWNWGWNQFAKRDFVYFNNLTTKQQDAFVIVCTLDSSPSAVPIPPIPSRVVPKALIDTVGSLLDDPTYSDVEFVLTKKRRDGVLVTKKILAARSLLRRSRYFEDMFSSGFAETSVDLNTDVVGPGFGEDDYDESYFEDSDDEDDIIFWGSTDEHEAEPPDEAKESLSAEDSNQVSLIPESPSGEADNPPADANTSDDSERRNVRQKLLHPSSPRGNFPSDQHGDGASSTPPNAQKLRVVIKDAAYMTYRAMLYYLYTDTIVFAPFSSAFCIQDVDRTSSASTPSSADDESTSSHSNVKGRKTDTSPSCRREWLVAWMKSNPGRPCPCSAKAVYRLADRLDLRQLKKRAFDFIVKSLAVENIAYEVFSRFATAFEEVQKVQITYFLEHWAEIRGSDAMRNVLTQLRSGRHPGFEEVWPTISQSLEYIPGRIPGGNKM